MLAMLALWVGLRRVLEMEVSGQDTFLCKICNNFASRYYSKVLRHIGLVHSFDPGFTITCGVDGCPKTFTKYNSFRKHILRHHREVLSLKSTNQEGSVEIHECSMDDLPSIHSNVQDTEYDSLSDNATERVKEDAHTNQAALFILKAKECLKVSQLALNTMLDDINTLLNVKLHETEHKVLSLLSRNHVSEEITKKTRDIFTSEESLFSGLHTTYNQNKYFVDHLGLVVSVHVLYLKFKPV